MVTPRVRLCAALVILAMGNAARAATPGKYLCLDENRRLWPVAVPLHLQNEPGRGVVGTALVMGAMVPVTSEQAPYLWIGEGEQAVEVSAVENEDGLAIAHPGWAGDHTLSCHRIPEEHWEEVLTVSRVEGCAVAVIGLCVANAVLYMESGEHTMDLSSTGAVDESDPFGALAKNACASIALTRDGETGTVDLTAQPHGARGKTCVLSCNGSTENGKAPNVFKGDCGGFQHHHGGFWERWLKQNG